MTHDKSFSVKTQPEPNNLRGQIATLLTVLWDDITIKTNVERWIIFLRLHFSLMNDFFCWVKLIRKKRVTSMNFVTGLINLPKNNFHEEELLLFASESDMVDAVTSWFPDSLPRSSADSPIKALYFLAIASQSVTFSIRVALLKLNWEPNGLRWTTDKATESEKEITILIKKKCDTRKR